MKQTVAYKDMFSIEGRAYQAGAPANTFHVNVDPDSCLDERQQKTSTSNHAGHNKRLQADVKAQWNFNGLRRYWPDLVWKI